MKCLVTGGAGFIGSHLADALVARGDEVTIWDNLSRGDRAYLPRQAAFVERDIRSAAANSESFHCVFHLAALARVGPSFDLTRRYYDVNVYGTHAMASAFGLNTRMVFASSGSAAQPHSNPYAMTKYLGEQLFTGTDAARVRLFNVYGPRPPRSEEHWTLLTHFENAWRRGNPLRITGNGRQTRAFTHVDDAVDGLIRASEPDVVGLVVMPGELLAVNMVAAYFDGGQVYCDRPRGDIMHSRTAGIRVPDWNPRRTVAEYVEEITAR